MKGIDRLFAGRKEAELNSATTIKSDINHRPTINAITNGIYFEQSTLGA
jgi:hypothetical protein